MPQLPRAILLDLDDTILLAFGQAAGQWQRVVAAFAEHLVPHPPDDLRGALLAFVEAAPIGATGYVLPTYTAMLEIRRTLADLGVVQAFWRQ